MGVADQMSPQHADQDTEDILASLAAALRSPAKELSPANRARLERARASTLRLRDRARAGGERSAAQAPGGVLLEVSAQQPVTSALPPGSESTSGHASKGRVLLAVVDPKVEAYVRELLADQFEVDVVDGGAVALAHIRMRRPDLLLVGARVQRLDGFDLLQAIAEDSSLADLPVILLSATQSENARLAGIRAGASGLLVKPRSAGELAARAAAAIETRHAAREALAAERRRAPGCRRSPPHLSPSWALNHCRGCWT